MTSQPRTTEFRTLDTRNGHFRIALDGPIDAPVLVFSNSLGTTLEMWDPQAARFARDHRVLRYDTRGHRGGPPAGPTCRFDRLGDDVLAILDALEIERARFCGISMGGHTALWLGVHAGARFDALAACNTAAKIGTEAGWHDRASQVREGGAAAMQALAATAPERWFTADFARAHPAIVALAQGWLGNSDPDGYAACCDALAVSDLRNQISAITVPMLVVAGEFDPVTTVADSRQIKEAIAGAELVSLPASHLSNLEAPGAFDQALSSFLQRRS